MRWKITNAITFVLLSCFVAVFYGAIYFQLPWGCVFFAGGFFLFAGLFVEAHRAIHRKYMLSREIEAVVVTLTGGLAAFFLSGLDAGAGPLGSVIGAGVVGLAGFEILKKFGAQELAAPLYCGAFVGMSSPVIFSAEMVAAASMVAGVVYIAAHGLYSGTGGTLGTIAFVGTTIIRKLTGG